MDITLAAVAAFDLVQPNLRIWHEDTDAARAS